MAESQLIHFSEETVYSVTVLCLSWAVFLLPYCCTPTLFLRINRAAALSNAGPIYIVFLWMLGPNLAGFGFFFPKYNFAQNSLVSPDLNSLSQATVSVRISFSSSQKTIKCAFQGQTYKVLYGKRCFLTTLDVNCLASSWMTWPWIFPCFLLQKVKKVSLVFQYSFFLNDSYVLNYSTVFTRRQSS